MWKMGAVEISFIIIIITIMLCKQEEGRLDEGDYNDDDDDSEHDFLNSPKTGQTALPSD